jgi:hypothetical protein
MGDYAIKRFRGDTKPIGIIVTKDKVAMDITDHTFKLTVNIIKDPTPTDTPLFTLDGTIVTALEGKVQFPITPLQADALGSYYYDVQMTDPSGYIKTLAKDNFKFEQDITK